MHTVNLLEVIPSIENPAADMIDSILVGYIDLFSWGSVSRHQLLSPAKRSSASFSSKTILNIHLIFRKKLSIDAVEDTPL